MYSRGVMTAVFPTLCFAVALSALAAPLPQDGLLLRFDANDPATVQVRDGRVVAWISTGTAQEKAGPGTPAQAPRLLARTSGLQHFALYYDGIDDALCIPSFNKKLDTWTLAAVVAPHSPAKGGGICSARSRDGHDYDPGLTVDLFQASGAFDQISVEGAGRIEGQKDQMRDSYPWGGAHLVVVVREPQTVRLFVDGIEQDSRPVSPAVTVLDEFRIGARHYAGTERQYFCGEMTSLLFYDRALSQEDLKSLESALSVSEAERKAGEESFAAGLKKMREERMKNRMKAPQIVKSWPSLSAWQADCQAVPPLTKLPVRTDLKNAIELCVRHLNSLYDRDRNDEPFFYSNHMADGTGKMFHSVNIGIPHVVGRCLLGCMAAEMTAGIPFPQEGLTILERYCRSSFDNPDHLNSYYDPEKGNARCVEFHNMREGLFSLWALAAGRDSQWARNEIGLMLKTLDKITNPDGTWNPDRVKALETGERGYGVAIPNAARVVEPLLAVYDVTKDETALRLAGLYARKGIETMFQGDGRFAEMDRSSGHVHSITSSLAGITAWAIRANDAEMLAKCRKIMDVGVPEYFSSWGWGDEVFPDHPADVISRGEINQTGDVIRTALMLGDAGYPEYFEMAERYLRSMLLPTQHREPELSAFLKDKTNPADDSERDVLARTVGGFAMQSPNDRMQKGDWPLSTLDITSGAVHALSDCCAHRAVLKDGVCSVNLLFDCETDAVSVKSGLPFEGNVTVKALKPLAKLRVLLPPWANPDSVKAKQDGNPAEFTVAGRFIEMIGIRAGVTASVSFDLPCKIEKETVDGVEYTTTWVGSQIIEISPRGEISPLPF